MHDPSQPCPPLPCLPPHLLRTAEADLDAPKTFQDKVDDREKLRLVSGGMVARLESCCNHVVLGARRVCTRAAPALGMVGAELAAA